MTTPRVGPVDLEIIRHRLDAINADAADILARVSGSQIASESNDLNTVVMDADGTVIACGRYIVILSLSVHYVVQDILKHFGESPGIRAGDQFITNDPYVGTLHQPDVVVVAPVFDGERLIAWVGSSVHEADVGGPVPGGMNYAARSIYEEATPMPPMKIVEAGRMRHEVEREYLIRSRTPDLNALDLLGQIAANKASTDRILALCTRYGTDMIVVGMRQLLESTELAFRDRLRELPDGVWRHACYIEHERRVGLSYRPNQVYAVRCTLTKRGDTLELDFRDSDGEAPGVINSAYPGLVNFTMGALLVHLCQGLAWVPGAIRRAVTILSREGSVVHARWPAGVAMGVGSSGQAIRTCVSSCVARLLDASASHRDMVMASSQYTGAGSAILSGVDAANQPFSTMFLDELTGGGGGKAREDGIDSSGTSTSPGAVSSNVEINEAYYPVLYVSRQEMPDSAGPGQHRGGVGTVIAYRAHGTCAPMDVLSIGSGLQHPSAPGAAGGEPGMPSALAVFDDPLVGPSPRWTELSHHAAAQLPSGRLSLPGGHTLVVSNTGGGGYGDPLDRAPELVLRDAVAGLVSVAGARDDYGVVLGGEPRALQLDASETLALRNRVRRDRLRGRAPRERNHERSGRRLSSHLDAIPDRGVERVCCAHCGEYLCRAGEPLYERLVLRTAPPDERFPLGTRYAGSERFCLRHFYCPGCAIQLDVHIALVGEPLMRAIETGAPTAPLALREGKEST